MFKEYPKKLYMSGDIAKAMIEVHDAAQERTFRAAGFRQQYFAYPRSLHKAGDRLQEERVVQDEKEEQAARAEGFLKIGEQPAAPTAKPDEPAEAPAVKRAKKAA